MPDQPSERALEAANDLVHLRACYKVGDPCPISREKPDWCSPCLANLRDRNHVAARLDAFAAEARREESALLRQADADAMEAQRACAWLLGDDVGISSKTIIAAMLGVPIAHPGVPHDPPDFGRCHRLLKAFPEFRKHLSTVAVSFPEWRRLVECWDELEAIYEAGHMGDLWELLVSSRARGGDRE